MQVAQRAMENTFKDRVSNSMFRRKTGVTDAI